MLLLLFVTLTTAAEGVVRTGCRRGHIPQHVSAQFLQRARRAGSDATSAYLGNRRQLVVMVAFSDLQFQGDETETMTLWNSIFNEQGFSEQGLHGSVHDYFYDQSYGLFDLTFDLQYVALSHAHSKYRSTASDDENSQYLVYDIIDQLATRDIDWSLYDWDDDGYVDQLIIIYAGKGQNAGGGSNTIWPHQWWLSIHESGHTCTVTSQDKDYVVDSYCCVQELIGTGYGSFGTICHEYSHCLGLPDFYYGRTQYVGSWDLMDYGNNNGSGFLPCGYSAHERWLMGWMDLTELKEGTTVTDMAALSDRPQAYLLRNDGYPNEYFILENRQRQGWDSSLPSGGLVVFHVDYDEAVWKGVDDYPNHPDYVNDDGLLVPEQTRYSIVPANNMSYTSYSSGWPYPYNTNNSLTDESTPATSLLHNNTDGTTKLGKPVTNIRVIDGLASFDVLGGATAIGTVHQDAQPAQVLYRVGPVAIVRQPDGTVVKVCMLIK